MREVLVFEDDFVPEPPNLLRACFTMNATATAPTMTAPAIRKGKNFACSEADSVSVDAASPSSHSRDSTLLISWVWMCTLLQAFLGLHS